MSNQAHLTDSVSVVWTLIRRQFSETNPYNLPNYTHHFLSLRYETDAHKNITLQPRFLLPDNYVKGTVRISHSLNRESLHDHHLPVTLAEVRPPTQKGQPVVVEFSIFVVDINSINVEDMDYR